MTYVLAIGGGLYVLAALGAVVRIAIEGDWRPLLAFLVAGAFVAVFVLALVGVIDAGSSGDRDGYCADTHGPAC